MLKKLTPLFCLVFMFVSIVFTGCEKAPASGVNVSMPTMAQLDELLVKMGIDKADVEGLLVTVMDADGVKLDDLLVGLDELGDKPVDVNVDVDVTEEEAVVVVVDVVVGEDVTVDVDVNVTEVSTEVNVGVLAKDCTVTVDVDVDYEAIISGEMVDINNTTVDVDVNCGNTTVGVGVDVD